MRLVKTLTCTVVVVVLCLFILSYLLPGKTVDIRYQSSGSHSTHLEEDLSDSQDKYKHIAYSRKESVVRLLSGADCRCEPDASLKSLFVKNSPPQLREAFSASEREDVEQRREREYKLFLQRTKSPVDELIVAKANSPLEFPTQGVEVRPMKTILLPGLRLKAPPQELYKVDVKAELGSFDVAAEVAGVKVEGEGGTHLSLSSSQLDNLNRQLQFLTYTNTVFHPNTADTVQFETDGHRAQFTVKIRHPLIPKLYDVKSQSGYNISALVTIATKTFLRYGKLREMIDSVRKYYPDVTIIVADDSDKPEKIQGAFIEHYIMPFRKGWFAGRNLAVSQTKTKYLLWVDDDFIFTGDTKIEKMVDVLERTTLDMVGGSVREVTRFTATYRHQLSVEAGGKEGDCLEIRKGYYHTLEGFPNCVVADAIINFFLARTEKIQEVGFDPHLSRWGHLEFFVDGLGRLHVGSCSDVIVDHASKIKLPWTRTDKSEILYKTFRYPQSSEDGQSLQSRLFFFKNRLRCIKS
ncbi:beta-1,4 N-acetylgalactosaminyltransferase 1 [Callorhinchus milii]|uniref:beta-1,4 N-acetylgalactosaminyltransferase 1 n=1 Tax=Callorhinchus milii TaxID=7868 RepID=UPI001C3FA345|nr:beta-1,4 N-acetylgalactosaminyltransferase 1 [Callorhinchus milii]XP_042200330.1 beta-1,4 N-acetylgalactosaminyltransferase 1 [Callorhinchus milii]XP_042200331.1 beta-1,4 N-acetylgalactosaminyltransferase 1 [Callorhinchus milii]XP_042200332.1 beta-1,4 N-acetylgalactosaminyltransferase 1 [Callorhinchus milii]